jgi:hypothetical protein
MKIDSSLNVNSHGKQKDSAVSDRRLLLQTVFMTIFKWGVESKLV